MKKTIKIIAYSIMALALTTLSVVTVLQHGRIKDHKVQIQEQSRVIDSLLTIRRNYIDVQLNVTDKSSSKIYGRYNKGTITMPSERTYKLVIDSVQVKLK